MEGGVVFDASWLKESGMCETVQPDPEHVAQARQRRQRSMAVKVKARQHARFVGAASELAELLPATFDPGDSWHVVSNGDLDALSFVKHVRQAALYQTLILSSWAISMPAIEYMAAEHAAGRLSRVDAYVGEIMPRDRMNQYAALCALVSATGGRVMTLRTHAKVWLLLADDGSAVTIETSANANYNKRIEQTVLTGSPSVAVMYKHFLDALDVPTPTFPNWVPHGWPSA